MRHFSLLLIIFIIRTADAQFLVDTTFVWHGYSSSGITRMQLYENAADIERPRTVVIKELAENQGPSIVEDLPYLAEEIGRAFHFDPSQTYWILHWGSFSYKGAERSPKDIFLRATFRRSRNQQLSSPLWRVVDREHVEELTDRAFKESDRN